MTQEAARGGPAGRGRRLADWRVWAGAVTGAVLAGVVGASVPDAFAVGGAVAVLGLAVQWLDGGRDEPWPDSTRRIHDGRRVEVSDLTWSLAGRDGRVSGPAARHLREVAAARLARVGLPLSAGFDGPADAVGLAQRCAARDALGDRAWTALMPDRTPSLADVAACVQALEALTDRSPTSQEQR
ncbi:hypothetical protein Q6348_03390 [Isoptericola sp. b441]|uniref:Uncharacterized protein n=1 Tax=Actinotalea lenta TaxID=3064654 RepID=A0ABT9D752_9CELL|nr:hypothetical protein [Isoptericola sp. b441]MDO8106236.1 hypothetical protein [Isoptericola sp. b441]